MTQSGQGEEPSAQPAREGIVLPSDGGEPLLPGTTGGPVGPGTHGGPQPGPYDGQQYQQQPGPQYHQQPGRPYDGQDGQGGRPYDGQGGGPAAAPAGGQAWGSPWGPQQPPQSEQTWQAPPQQGWAAADRAPSGAGPLPPQDAQPPAYGYPPAPQQPGVPSAAYGYPPAPQQPGAHSPAYGYPPAPPADGGYGAPGGAPVHGAPGHGAQGQGGYGQGPRAAGPYAPAHGSPGAPVPHAGAGGQGAPAGPQPSAGDGATQYLPPVAASAPAHGADEGATQYLPPVADRGAQAHRAPHRQGAPDDAATRLIRPVGPGALPPEAASASGPESTQVLGRAARPGAGPLPPAAGSDADATQYIAPVPGGPGAQAPYGGGADRQQPPVEFDNLFRGGPGGDAHAGATQQMPQVPRPEQPGHGAQPAYIPPRSGRDEDGGDERRRGGRSGSRLPLIAAVGVAIAVLGVGAGALLGSSGDEDDGKDGGSTTVSATAPATSAAPSPSADPARQQAVALDKLLADSGSSRATVIKAVADVKGCRNLGQAAADLRDAGRQRNDLVTRLAALQVDKLPDHAALTSALTDAWKASASADDHYAAWADQVAKNKGKLCKKGQARSTDQTVAANKSSNTASAQKKTAAGLWNAIARTYGLSERQATQL